jgi:hypothetical protein
MPQNIVNYGSEERPARNPIPLKFSVLLSVVAPDLWPDLPRRQQAMRLHKHLAQLGITVGRRRPKLLRKR